MGHAIFISYRRDDTEGEAGRLYDDLVRTFGDACVFMDVSGISPGVDFRRAIDDNVSSCGVLLAMIGPGWLSVTNPDGRRRLDDPSDFVVLEIASALKRNVPVIPVLVHDARMPHPDQLPEGLKDLAYRNSVELTHARWNSDAALLISALKAYVSPPAKAVESDPVHATVPVQLPAPHAEPAARKTPPQKSNAGLIAGIVLGALALAAILFMVLHRTKPQTTAQAPDSTQQPANPATTPSAAPTPAGTATTPAQPPQVSPASSPSPTPSSAAPSSPAAPSASPSATPALPINALQGKWSDSQNRGAESLTTIEIICVNNRRLIMHASATCMDASRTCDWGRVPADFDGKNATATFAPKFNEEPHTSRVAKITVHPDGPDLDVIVDNTFNDGKTVRFKTIHRVFVRSN